MLTSPQYFGKILYMNINNVHVHSVFLSTTLWQLLLQLLWHYVPMMTWGLKRVILNFGSKQIFSKKRSSEIFARQEFLGSPQTQSQVSAPGLSVCLPVSVYLSVSLSCCHSLTLFLKTVHWSSISKTVVIGCMGFSPFYPLDFIEISLCLTIWFWYQQYFVASVSVPHCFYFGFSLGTPRSLSWQ